MRSKRDRLPRVQRMAKAVKWLNCCARNDIVYLSFVRHVLDGEGIEHLLLDEYASAVEGSINAIPRRIVVAEEHAGARANAAR